MDIELLLSFTVICAITGIVLRRYRPEYALLVLTVGALTAVSAAVSALSPIMNLINRLTSFIPDGEKYVPLLLKCAGTAILTEIAVGICSDCGETALAKSASIGGKIAIVLFSLPALSSLAEIIVTMIKT